MRQETTAVIPSIEERAELARADILDAFAVFLRLNVAEGDASPETIRAYHAQVGAFVEWCEAKGINPALATDEGIALYRKELVEAGYARTTISAKLNAVRRLYQAAAWRGLRRDNPAEGIRPPGERTAPEERVKFLPLAGLMTLLDAPPDNVKGKRDRVILALMGKHGLRVSEVVGLGVGDYHAEEPAYIVVHGKGKKERTVYLTASTKATLEAWIEARGEPGGSFLFVALDHAHRGTPLTTNGARHIVDGWLEELGLKGRGISCHALRHSAATWARAGGAKVDAIADMLGHSSVDTTRIYSKIVDRLKENPTRYLEELMGRGGDEEPEL